MSSDEMPMTPLIIHLVVTPPPLPSQSFPQLTRQHISIHEKYLQPQGLVFDPLSVGSAKEWLETTDFEEAGVSYLNTLSAVKMAEILRAHHVTEEPQQSPQPPQPIPPPQPAPNQAGLVFQVVRIMVPLLFLQLVLDYPLTCTMPLAVLLCLYHTGHLERLLKHYFPSLFQVGDSFSLDLSPHPKPNPVHVPGQPPPPLSLFQTITRLAHVPTSQGAVVDIYSFVSAFIFSLYPGYALHSSVFPDSL